MNITFHDTEKERQDFMTEYIACWIASRLEFYFNSWSYYEKATRY